MASTTNAQVLAAINALAGSVAILADRVVALEAKPITNAPKVGKAESPFVGFLRERAAAKLPCGIESHEGKCNRTFSPNSAGLYDHTARIV